jgi:hypothetical protein
MFIKKSDEERERDADDVSVCLDCICEEDEMGMSLLRSPDSSLMRRSKTESGRLLAVERFTQRRGRKRRTRFPSSWKEVAFFGVASSYQDFSLVSSDLNPLCSLHLSPEAVYDITVERIQTVVLNTNNRKEKERKRETQNRIIEEEREPLFALNIRCVVKLSNILFDGQLFDGHSRR